MFEFFRKRRIKKYAEDASAYVRQKYIAPYQPSEIRYSLSVDTTVKQQKKKPESTDPTVKHQYSDSDIRYSDRDSEVRYSDRDTGERYSSQETDISSGNIKYSLRKKPKAEDPYNASEVTRLLRNYSTAGNFNEMLRTLEQSVNQTFVDRLLHYINEKGVRDSEVYKAAQVDKRLFSKMVSNREYKPSKDTAIALALALELSLEEATDMLSRAGYTFSHSNKRDIIIEFFFREKVYNLMDANDVLYRLNQKLIGRS